MTAVPYTETRSLVAIGAIRIYRPLGVVAKYGKEKTGSHEVQVAEEGPSESAILTRVRCGTLVASRTMTRTTPTMTTQYFWFHSMKKGERTWSLCLTGVMRLDPLLVTTRTCGFPATDRQGGLRGDG